MEWLKNMDTPMLMMWMLYGILASLFISLTFIREEKKSNGNVTSMGTIYIKGQDWWIAYQGSYQGHIGNAVCFINQHGNEVRLSNYVAEKFTNYEEREAIISRWKLKEENKKG